MPESGDVLRTSVYTAQELAAELYERELLHAADPNQYAVSVAATAGLFAISRSPPPLPDIPDSSDRVG